MTRHVLDIDGLRFEFQSDWMVGKYDDWKFYREKFSTIRNDIKAIDILAISADRILFMIEVKDYTKHSRTKPSELHDEIGAKVISTLAALLPASLHAFEDSERLLASHALAATKIGVILHLEQPKHPSKLFPRFVDPANVQDKMRKKLKIIDAHPKVVCATGLRRLGWTVSRS